MSPQILCIQISWNLGERQRKRKCIDCVSLVTWIDCNFSLSFLETTTLLKRERGSHLIWKWLCFVSRIDSWMLCNNSRLSLSHSFRVSHVTRFLGMSIFHFSTFYLLFIVRLSFFSRLHIQVSITFVEKLQSNCVSQWDNEMSNETKRLASSTAKSLHHLHSPWKL